MENKTGKNDQKKSKKILLIIIKEQNNTLEKINICLI